MFTRQAYVSGSKLRLRRIRLIDDMNALQGCARSRDEWSVRSEARWPPLKRIRDQCPCLIRRDVACDDHGRCACAVPQSIELPHILPRQRAYTPGAPLIRNRIPGFRRIEKLRELFVSQPSRL